MSFLKIIFGYVFFRLDFIDFNLYLRIIVIYIYVLNIYWYIFFIFMVGRENIFENLLIFVINMKINIIWIYDYFDYIVFLFK